MATDPDPTPPDEDPDDEDIIEVDREDLRTMIREELRGVIDDIRGGGKDPAPDNDPGPDAPATVKGIEAAVNAAMQKAMGDLAKKSPPKKTAPKKAKPDPEPTPDDPPRTWLDKAREKAWG